MRNRLAGLALATLASFNSLVGCVSVGLGDEQPAHAYRALHDTLPTQPARAQPLVGALLIQAQAANALVDTVSIAYSRQPHEFSFYQQASWSERPAHQLQHALQRRLEVRGVAATVGVLGDPVRADWLLVVGVQTLHHDVSSLPGEARLAVVAELFDRTQRRRVARQLFEAAQPSTRGDSAAAVAAMSQAMAAAFDALVPWAETELQKAVASTAK